MDARHRTSTRLQPPVREGTWRGRGEEGGGRKEEGGEEEGGGGEKGGGWGRREEGGGKNGVGGQERSTVQPIRMQASHSTGSTGQIWQVESNYITTDSKTSLPTYMYMYIPYKNTAEIHVHCSITPPPPPKCSNHAHLLGLQS